MDKISLKHLLTNIANTCDKNVNYVGSNGLFNGKMGVALFFFYYYDYSGVDTFFYRGTELLKEVLKDLKNGRAMTAYLANGLCGVTWSMDILFRNDILEDSAEEILGVEFSDLLLTRSENAFKIGNQDYLHGPWGIANHLTEKDIDLMPLLAMVLKYSETVPNSTKYSSLGFANSVIDFEISLAHGDAGSLAVLGNIYKKSRQYFFLKKEILRQADDLLKRVKSSITILDTGSNKEITNKCYSWYSGYLSACFVLINIFEDLSEKEKCRELIFLCEQLAINCIKTQPIYSDVYVCRGAMGYAYLFNKLHQKYSISIFKRASNYWLCKTVDHFNLINSGKMQSQDNFLESIKLGLINGLSGIGLCLLTLLGEKKKYNWDKIILLS